ncbi:BLUF domain-containing protein [Hymenobacter canadensis]|uniref:BLUF domain-containing protein n=1 Tax=Hymenobacter canadensis TaxID=2999067 RepID=A0ABY7LPS2_9BACT|nr:BLUF domain-containing protein [Hymenobacter canadensis]WBA42424.1 BLUF domain-containing protein [Hymenobacter canadensis]
MHHIVYQSTAVGHPTTAALRQLLRQARSSNRQLGITGLLLFSNDSFLQVLEGEQSATEALYSRITADYRHTCILRLSNGFIPQRIFPDWSMGFQSLSGEDFGRLTGYINPYRSDFLDRHLPEMDEGMLCLLRSFVVEDGWQL